MTFPDLLQSVDRSVLSLLRGDQAVTYQPGAGQAVSVSAIWDGVFNEVSPGGMAIVSASPQIFCRLSDLPSDPRTDGDARIFVDGVEHLIREPQVDGQGGILLPLHKVT